MKIFTDTCAQYSPEAASKVDIVAIPMQILYDGLAFKEYVELSPETLLSKIVVDHVVPSSSQPSPYDIKNAFGLLEENEQGIAISIADGLSGTYNSFSTMRLSIDHPEHLVVYNSKTIAGPQRYMARYARKLADNGLTMDEIVEKLDEIRETTWSYLIPQDFQFLKRGGRCNAVTAKLGGLLNLQVAVTIDAEGRHLDKFAITRTVKAVTKKILDDIECKIDPTKPQHFYVVHADNELMALQMVSAINTRFPNQLVEVLPLCPTCIVHGGPGCVAIQVIEDKLEAMK